MPKKKMTSSISPAPPRELLINDPIYRFISKISVPVFWTIILITHLLVYITVGLTVDKLYPNATDLLGIRDIAEIVNGINVWVVFAPTVWAYYRWLPENVLRGFKEIEELGVIAPLNKNNNPPLSNMLQRGIDSKWVQFLAVVAIVISSLYLLLLVIPVQEKNLNGLIDFWYYTAWSTFVFFLLYIPVNYAIFVFALRVLITGMTVNRFFQTQGVIANLYPLHPDKCGGMGNIGNLVAKTTLIVVLIPIWITIVSLFTLLAGGNSQFMLALIVYTVYIILVPIVLIFPLWQPHKAMVRYKNQRLFSLSKELLDLERELSTEERGRDWSINKDKLDRYKQLEEMYSALERNIPVWPISLPALRTFGTIAGSPVIVGLLSNLLFEYFKNLL